jgi:hypothetical protein
LAISTELPGLFPNWRFGPTSEADFEPLLALRIDVMREHLERVFRYKPSGRGASSANISRSPGCG